MKTDYFLEKLTNEDEARKALSDLMPGRTEPWLLLSAGGDVIAWFDFNSQDGEPLSICASVSSRYYSETEPALAMLRRLQQRIGGIIEDDFGNVI